MFNSNITRAESSSSSSVDSKYTVADILSSMANGDPAPSDPYSDLGLGFNNASRLSTVTTPLLTPTTLASIATFIELESVPVTSSITTQDLSRQSGFVPPIVNPAHTSNTMGQSEYYGTESDSDPDWEEPSAKSSRLSIGQTSVIKQTLGYSYSNNTTASPSSTNTSTGRRPPGPRRMKNETLTPEEEERRRMRRERNKLAAAKCRQRRVDQTNELINETENLEENKANLENEIQTLQSQKEQLEFLLEAHKPMCSAKNGNSVHVKQERTDPEDLTMFQDINGGIVVTTVPSTTSVTSRPSFLPLRTRTTMSGHTPMITAVTEATGVMISTPSAGILTLGLDSMADGHTGLTPITGAPSCASEVHRSSSDSSPSEHLNSPTLMAL